MHHRRKSEPKKNIMLPLLGLLLVGMVTAVVCVQLTQAAPHRPDGTPPRPGGLGAGDRPGFRTHGNHRGNHAAACGGL